MTSHGRPIDSPSCALMLCFARSGGTVLNQCLGLLPDSVILSEVSPLGGGGPNYPTVWEQAYHWYGIELQHRDYVQGICELADVLASEGRQFVVRDWTYPCFVETNASAIAKASAPRRLLALEALETKLLVRPFVFTRNVIDIYLSLGIDSGRASETFFASYRKFAERVAERELPVFHYEKFVLNPDVMLKSICHATGLSWAPVAQRYRSFQFVNGDIQRGIGSRGRRKTSIAPLKRRRVSSRLLASILDDPDVKSANSLLGYYGDESVESEGTFSWLRDKVLQKLSS